MKRLLALTIAPLLVTTGCLHDGETSTDLYIDPDGSVTWTVTQKEIYSDESDPQARHEEEQAFLVEARADRHPTARALERLGARWVETRIVRDRRPFTVVTEGSFDGIDFAFREFFEAAKLPWWVELERDGSMMKLTFVEEDGPEADDPEELDELALMSLVAGENLRFVLTEGTFIEAEGFRLEDGGRVAVPADPDEDDLRELEELGQRKIWLTWTVPAS